MLLISGQFPRFEELIIDCVQVFKKKIKRAKKAADMEGDSDESDSDDDYDSSSEEEDDDDDAEHLDLNVCPAGCR